MDGSLTSQQCVDGDVELNSVRLGVTVVIEGLVASFAPLGAERFNGLPSMKTLRR